MTLSAIQAIQRGRKLVPNFVSGVLANFQTHKGREAWWDREDQVWVYEGSWDGETEPLGHEPDIGAACLLGAQAIAMGIDIAEIGDTTEAVFYVHPDFIPGAEQRSDYPRGYVYGGEVRLTKIASAKVPCGCHAREFGSQPYEDETYPIPELIAHLNDQHDPRSDSASAVSASGTLKDPWSEQRIIEWLRSMGYNGGHA